MALHPDIAATIRHLASISFTRGTVKGDMGLKIADVLAAHCETGNGLITIDNTPGSPFRLHLAQFTRYLQAISSTGVVDENILNAVGPKNFGIILLWPTCYAIGVGTAAFYADAVIERMGNKGSNRIEFFSYVLENIATIISSAP